MYDIFRPTKAQYDYLSQLYFLNTSILACLNRPGNNSSPTGRLRFWPKTYCQSRFVRQWKASLREALSAGWSVWWSVCLQKRFENLKRDFFSFDANTAIYHLHDNYN